MQVSAIVPVWNDAGNLAASLGALARALPAEAELIVVDDGSTDDSAAVAARLGARVIRLERNAGAAAARNAGVASARAPLLLFVDADVAVAPGTVERLLAWFETRPDLDAVFGSYDDRPARPGLVSQFRNLLHHYVHQHGNPEAATFWAGFGAVRRAAFEQIGGFSTAPQWTGIEDIELGYRLRRAGHRILLDKSALATHLKRWTVVSMVRTDLCRRALPWARLMLATGERPRDLNLAWAQRASLACVALAGALAIGGLVLRSEWLAGTALLAAIVVLALNRGLYAFLARRRGVAFAVGCVPLHFLYFTAGGLGAAYAWLSRRPA